MCRQAIDERRVFIRGEPKGIDGCIVGLVVALNNAGLFTRASCCGHGKQPGRISLEDGREIILLTYDQAQTACQLFPKLNEPVFPVVDKASR